MGIFSQNYRPGFNNYTVEAAEGYGGPGADSKIMLECYQNDMALFEGLIASDFHAAYAAINGSVTESTVITEGAIGDFFKKIKEMFLKLIEKIKGLVKSFMIKFVAVFIRDNKQLVRKYHKQVMANLNDRTKKMDEMTFKAHEYVIREDGSMADFNKLVAEFTKDDTLMEDAYKKRAQFKTSQQINDLRDNVEDYAVEKLNQMFDLSINSISELKSALLEDALGEVTEITGYTDSLNRDIETALTNGSKTINALKRGQSKTESMCKKNIKFAEDEQKKADKLKEGETLYGYDASTASAYTSYFYKLATIDQTWMTAFIGVELEYVKVALKEARSVYIKAAARRAVKEDAVLFDMIDEASNYEVDTMFESEDYKDVPEEEIENDINQVVDDIADERCR